VLQSIADASDCPSCSRRNVRRVHPLAPDNGAKLLIAELCHKVCHRSGTIGHIPQADAFVASLEPFPRQAGGAAGLGPFFLGGHGFPCWGSIRTRAQASKGYSRSSCRFQLFHHHQR